MKNYFNTLTAAAIVLVGVSTASAVPTLTLTDGAGNTASGVLGPAGNGQWVFTGSVGDWSVNVTTGLTYPLLGSSSVPQMDLNSVDRYLAGSSIAKGGPAIGAGGNTLTITFTVDGFGPAINGLLNAQIGGTQSPNSSLLFTSGVNGNPLTSSGLITTSPFANSQNGLLSLFNGTLSETIVLTANGTADIVSFNAALKSTVPDSGMTLTLLGSSLTVLGLFARRKQ